MNRYLFIAGFIQVAAAFTPAGHAPLVGDISFIHLPTAGVVFVVLGLITAATALRPRGWWRWIPGLASLALLCVVYARLRYAPSGGFLDPMLRRVVHPSWGFGAMALAALLMLVAAATVRAASPVRVSAPLNER